MNANTYTNETIEMLWRGTLAIAAVAIFAMLPLEVLATTDRGAGTALDNVLCNIVSFFTGAVGKGIATIALIIIGIGALMGKISWGMALIVALGIALVFGATTLVDALGASEGGTTSSGLGASDCTTGGYGIEGVT